MSKFILSYEVHFFLYSSSFLFCWYIVVSSFLFRKWGHMSLNYQYFLFYRQLHEGDITKYRDCVIEEFSQFRRAFKHFPQGLFCAKVEFSNPLPHPYPLPFHSLPFPILPWFDWLENFWKLRVPRLLQIAFAAVKV